MQKEMENHTFRNYHSILKKSENNKYEGRLKQCTSIESSSSLEPAGYIILQRGIPRTNSQHENYSVYETRTKYSSGVESLDFFFFF